MHYGCLGIVTEVTLRTVELQILYCKKLNTDFQFLLDEFSAMNEAS
jgi:FAD/FMN-containing dehydrogenase